MFIEQNNSKMLFIICNNQKTLSSFDLGVMTGEGRKGVNEEGGGGGVMNIGRRDNIIRKIQLCLKCLY